MKANTLSVQATQPPSIAFADSFNAAVHMIDRHIDEGNGPNTAIDGAFDAVTYAELAERVNRAGNALADSGLTAGDRILLVLRDGPEFFYVFWGAVKAGFIPVPLHTLLRPSEYQFIITTVCAKQSSTPKPSSRRSQRPSGQRSTTRRT